MRDAGTLGIGGVAAAVLTDDAGIARLLRTRYRGFVGDGDAEWRLRVSRRRAGVAPGRELDITVDGPVVHVARHDFAARLDLRAREAAIGLGAVDSVALDACVRVLWSLALLECGGLLVHAASLARGGEGRVFPGPSGSGKTTLARLPTGARVLSDEVSIVRAAGDGAVCCGTPFWGELGQAGANVEVPLAGLHFIHHAPVHTVQGLPRRAALPALLRNVLFFAPDPGLRARVFTVAAELVERVPASALGFRRAPGLWEVLSHA